jgi:hypothetical protein
MASEDITIEILKNLRSEMRERFDGMDQRFDAMDRRFDVLEERIDLTAQRLDITNERLGVVESTLMTLARRQRSTRNYLKTADERLGVRVTDLEGRVGRLENAKAER